MCKRCECKREHSSLCLRLEHQEGCTEEGLLGLEARGEVWQPDQMEAVMAETEVRLGSVWWSGKQGGPLGQLEYPQGGSVVGLEGAGCPAEESKRDSVSMGRCRSFLSQKPGWFLEPVFREKKPRQFPSSHTLPHRACGSKSVAFN